MRFSREQIEELRDAGVAQARFDDGGNVLELTFFPSTPAIPEEPTDPEKDVKREQESALQYLATRGSRRDEG